jgi:hypothetical protein
MLVLHHFEGLTLNFSSFFFDCGLTLLPALLIDRYLTKEFAVENLSFINACDEFTTLALTHGGNVHGSGTTGHLLASSLSPRVHGGMSVTTSQNALELSHRAVILYTRFVRPSSTFQVNLSSAIVTRIRQHLEPHIKYHDRFKKKPSREVSRNSRHAPAIAPAPIPPPTPLQGIPPATPTTTAAAAAAVSMTLMRATTTHSLIPSLLTSSATLSAAVATAAAAAVVNNNFHNGGISSRVSLTPAVNIPMPSLPLPLPLPLPSISSPTATGLPLASPHSAMSSPITASAPPPVSTITINVNLRTPPVFGVPTSPSTGPSPHRDTHSGHTHSLPNALSSPGGHSIVNDIPLPPLDTGLFGEARQAIFDLLQFDVFPRYLKSSVYDDYCNSNREQREALAAAAVANNNNNGNDSPLPGTPVHMALQGSVSIRVASPSHRLLGNEQPPPRQLSPVASAPSTPKNGIVIAANVISNTLPGGGLVNGGGVSPPHATTAIGRGFAAKDIPGNVDKDDDDEDDLHDNVVALQA